MPPDVKVQKALSNTRQELRYLCKVCGDGVEKMFEAECPSSPVTS